MDMNKYLLLKKGNIDVQIEYNKASGRRTGEVT